MGLYILRRVGQALVVLAGISVATFVLIHLVPGDPARAILGPRASPKAIAALRHQLGLDVPLLQQYLRFVANATRLNFGTSTTQQVPVSDLLWTRLAATLVLALYATVLSILIAVPLAIVSALRRNRLQDHTIRLVSMVTFAMPIFWLGLVLILLFAIRLPIFPTSGYGSGPGGHVLGLTLPALALGLGLAPLLIRTLRGSMVDTLRSEFVEAAHARGLPPRVVYQRYVMRNSLVATMTVIALNFSYLLGVTVVVENVFALPGLGSLMVTAVHNRDFPVVQAVALTLGVIVVVVNLMSDLAYALIDPRIRLDGGH